MDAVRQFASAFQDQHLVTVRLRGTEKLFFVQKALLCSVSDYFVKALQGGFKEGVEQTLTLPGCDVSTFELFLYWIARKELIEPNADDSDAQRVDAQVLLVRLWAFGQACLVPKLQNDAMRSFVDLHNSDRTEVNAVQEACSLLPEDSKMRQAILKCSLSSQSNNDYNANELDQLGAIPGYMRAMIGTFFNYTSRKEGNRHGLWDCQCRPVQCFNVKHKELTAWEVVEELTSMDSGQIHPRVQSWSDHLKADTVASGESIAWERVQLSFSARSSVSYALYEHLLLSGHT